MSSLSLHVVIKATKADKKDIMRFYKTQRYSASYIGQDQCYFIRADNEIIACTIVSAGKKRTEFWLLHALVTKQNHRGKGIASLLLRTITAEKHTERHPTLACLPAKNDAVLSTYSKTAYANIVCFADEALQPLYLSNQFISYNTLEDITELPNEFQQRLSGYKIKQNNLCCYIYRASIKTNSR